MATVETVRGPVPVEDLGTVLMHEHVFVLNEEIRRNYPHLWDEEAQVESAVRRLKALKDRGVDTIVDPTVLGLGRDIERVARINAQVDLNIVPATGLYTYNDVPFFFSMHGPGTPLGGDEPMVELFVRDITDGIAGTPIKAAFLKCAIEDALTPGVERVLHAVAETHHRTGVPITVHTNPNRGTGLVAQRVLRERGVDLGKVVIGHSGDTTDLDYLRHVIDAGSYLGMDRFGLDFLLPGDQRIATVAALAAQGLSDRMVLAHDASCHIDWLRPGVREQAMPNWHYTHLHDDVIPALREAGVTEDQLTTMLVENPRRYFTRDS
ncbi:phosphotriesterase family protein [Saccharomonospora xinjiangensis]|uniref:Putative metal-dependent hydrolase with the TIM-barrel fold n=1 Tax=Saccharomonospora xinjiangensis XJ-54 TaxID=882086 RepID=I0UYV5_9PSEU|nr:phosphotriesterase [Saccharomonospora xinjiangensis]EID53058.1 putative metal-dependent hydrolase with the TIM-barrel fold [Saccharomonospora xinjiangensis XJ-54]